MVRDQQPTLPSSEAGYSFHWDDNNAIIGIAKKWFNEIPFGTKWIMVGLSVMFLFLQCVFDYPQITSACLTYGNIVDSYEFYRLISYALLHAGIIHYLFNILAQISLSSMLETNIFKSTIKLFSCTLFTILSSSVIQILISFFIDKILLYVFGYNVRFGKFVRKEGSGNLIAILDFISEYSLMRECSIGFSGVAFSYLSIMSVNSFASSQSLFGLVQIPFKFYPWVLLFITELLMSGSSFSGHLFGILVGYLYVYIFESNTAFSNAYENLLFKIEEKIVPSFIKNSESYWKLSDQRQASNIGFFSHLMEAGQLNNSPSNYWERFSTSGRSIGGQ